MKIFIEKDYEALSRRTSEILMGEILQDKRVNLSITSGSSPKGAYDIMIPQISGRNDLEHVHYYTFDNFYPPESGPDGWGGMEMRKLFFDPAGIPEQNIHILTDKNYNIYDVEIEAAGGLDLLLAGLGNDGHFCANMPYAVDFIKGTYALEIKENYPWYTIMNELCANNVPKFMYTMGAVSVMKAHRLVLIVSGAKKAAAVKRLLTCSVTEEFPSSILKLHPNLTLILDQEAASLL